MNGDQLKALQAPIKDRYRSEPEAAVVTLRAEGRLGEDLSCSVQTGQALVSAGLHPATGGDGSFACSGDMLLQALAACAGVTMRSVATAIGVEATGVVRAEGDLDFRGTLGTCRVLRHPVVVRARERCIGGGAGYAAPSDRAVLRGAADARQQSDADLVHRLSGVHGDHSAHAPGDTVPDGVCAVWGWSHRLTGPAGPRSHTRPSALRHGRRRPSSPGRVAGGATGYPAETVRARIPRVARSAPSLITGKMPASRHIGSISDQS